MAEMRDVINRLNRVPEVMAIETRRAMTASLLLIEADARSLAPRDTGRLAGSIGYRIEGQGPSLVGRVGPSIAYAPTMEFGRRPGARMPPVEQLIPWIQRHWRAPLVAQQAVLPGFAGEVRSTNRRAAGRGVTQAMLRRRAFALALSIQRRGIRRRAYMRQAYGKNRGQIDVLFRSIGTRVAASITGRGGAFSL